MSKRFAIILSAIFCLCMAQAAAYAQQQTPLERLKANIKSITDSTNAQWGIYVKCLETGEEIDINADKPMATMSVIKIPLMFETFRQIEEGKFKLTDRVTIKDSDKRPGTGVIQSLDEGDSLTVKDLITLMIIMSDNSATDLLFDKVGGAEPVNSLMQKLGLNTIKASGPTSIFFADLKKALPNLEQFATDGKHPFGLSSARDMGRLLEMMEEGKAINEADSKMMLEIMRGQRYTSRLPRYVTGYEIPHKTGDFLPYVGNDVGVLESPNRHIVICVFDGNHHGVSDYLEDAVGRIAEQVGNYFAYTADKR